VIVLEVRTRRRQEFVNVTHSVAEAVARLGVENGAVLVYSPHTTAAVVIQEGADPAVAADIIARLELLAPTGDPRYQHREGNADAHIKTALLGNDKVIPVRGGRLLLGTWQQIFLAEFDGPRRRELWVKAL